LAGSLSFFTELDSTNNYAMQQIHAGMAKSKQGYATSHQFNGKGQRGKTWLSSPNEAIALSVVLDTTKLGITKQFLLSMAVAVGTANFAKKYIDNDVFIKWPNDLYWRDRKAGGILIENVVKGEQWQWAVIGIGINLNQSKFSSSLPNPISFSKITGKTYDVAKLTTLLYDEVLSQINSFNEAALKEEYNQFLFMKGQAVRLKKGNSIFETTIDEVDSYGCLYTHDSLARVFNFGEVEWML
jgi:BirA family transcriptional regulator, biotin operon repressor / biotin---[acetyl-CoA-carboxylase] ligase